MIKTWRVAVHEYLGHVRKKRFLFGLLSVPLVVLLMVGLTMLIVTIQMDNPPIGYVDRSGILADPLPGPEVEPPEKPVTIIAYPDEAAAIAAMDAEEIQGYYIVPEDYLETGQVTLYHSGQIREVARIQFYDLLSVNLLRDTDPAIVTRLIDGSDIAIETPDASRNVSGGNWVNLILPLVAGIVFIITMFSAGGYLMQAVVDEKENRTIEVLLTSVSPNQFMAGKILGDTAVGLTQIVAWGAFIIIGVLIGSMYTDVLQGLHISTRSLLIFLLVLLPCFLTVAALMAAVGATVSEAREGQQMTSWFSLPIWIPYMFSFMLVQNPNSPFSIILSVLPLTAPLAMLIRDAMTVVPAWQIAVAAVVQSLTALGAIWLAGRAFRLGMLRTGKRLKWRELFAKA